jgi:hypothetical protein
MPTRKGRGVQDAQLKIQVCIATDALLANVLPALIDRPDRVYLVTTDEMQARAGDLTRMLDAENIRSTVWRDASDGRWPGVADTAARLSEHIRATHLDADVTVNITGGLKPMAIGFMMGFNALPHRLIYMDMGHGVINQLELPPTPDQPIPDILDIRRYLLASGFRVDKIQSHDACWRRDVEEARELTGYLANHWAKIGFLADAFNTAAASARDKYESSGVPKSEPVRVPIERKRVLTHRHVMNRLVDQKIVTWSEDEPTFMEILDYSSAQYLGGFWLEEYVFLQLADIGLTDLAVSVSGTWQGGGVPRGDNEFDVVATHHNRLLFVECKAGAFKVDQKIQDTFGKIDAIGNRAAGRFGSVMMVSPRTLRPAAVARAAAGRIFVLDGTEITRVKEVVQRWMNGGKLERPIT